MTNCERATVYHTMWFKSTKQTVLAAPGKLTGKTVSIKLLQMVNTVCHCKLTYTAWIQHFSSVSALVNVDWSA